MISIITVFVVLFIVQVFFQIINTLEQGKIRRVSESTHIIVNSQRTLLLRWIAELTERIALENPTDKKAQEMASNAKQDADAADHPRRIQI